VRRTSTARLRWLRPILLIPSEAAIADLGEKQEPRRMISEAVEQKKELALCAPNREEVSLCSLCQDQLV